MGLVTRQKCSTKNNTACICGQGHFCVSESRGDCAECRPHTACRPGQRVRERGTQWQDTVCEDCPPGTFSPNGALEQCQPWTKCNSSFQSLVNPGTSSSDVTCSASHSPSPLTIIIPMLLLVGIIVPVAVTWIRMKRMKNRRSPGEATKERPLQAPPDVTTVATEETAFVS
ncbi:tumor necrosis factor receptor superfamily member 14 isoform X2 [Hyaena hyaena]|uniref:tumor necrosis factor receptor superfamily member 14 isoform X2 n=1 Tax=Hyaena hyaena TaxID=95912 RepID=UPI0019220FEC|nr:tumor necrosis factor receptor superfamily member 14 isoform X2 [Hyaena hyaena]